MTYKQCHNCKFSDSYGQADCNATQRNSCGDSKLQWQPLNEVAIDMSTTGIAHSLAGFIGAFNSEFKRMPRSQEIWNHAIRAYRDLKENNLPTKGEPFTWLLDRVDDPEVKRGIQFLITSRTAALEDAAWQAARRKEGERNGD